MTQKSFAQFSGSGKDEESLSVESWVRRFRTQLSRAKIEITSAEAKEEFELALVGKAANWYERQLKKLEVEGESRALEDWFDALVIEFHVEIEEEVLNLSYLDSNAVMKRPDEKISDWALRFHKEYHRIDAKFKSEANAIVKFRKYVAGYSQVLLAMLVTTDEFEKDLKSLVEQTVAKAKALGEHGHAERDQAMAIAPQKELKQEIEGLEGLTGFKKEMDDITESMKSLSLQIKSGTLSRSNI
jgi:hypothetical protein